MLDLHHPDADPRPALAAVAESLDFLRRMIGLDDGVVDALFGFTHPVSGGYYFCPPLREGRLDLRTLGIEQLGA